MPRGDRGRNLDAVFSGGNRTGTAPPRRGFRLGSFRTWTPGVRSSSSSSYASRSPGTGPIISESCRRIGHLEDLEDIVAVVVDPHHGDLAGARQIGRAEWREGGCQYVWIAVGAETLKSKKQNNI